MAKYTKKEFAGQIGMKTNALSVYIANGYVVVGDDGLIDTENSVNAHILEKRIAKGLVANFNASPQFIPKTPKEGDEDLPTYEESERKVKYFDSLKREKEVEKLQIEIDKKKGEVVPSELIIPLFLQHNKSIVTSFKNATDAILTEYSKLKDFTPAEISEMRGRMVSAINDGIRDAQDLTKVAVKNIISDYSDKRGVGERV